MALFRPVLRSRPSRGPILLDTHMLDPHEASLLAAIIELSVAVESDDCLAQTVRQVDRQLTGALARLQPAFRHGLAAWDQAAKTEFGSPFLELDARDRMQFVQRLERGHKLTAVYRLVVSQAEIAVSNAVRQPAAAEADSALHLEQPFVKTEHAR